MVMFFFSLFLVFIFFFHIVKLLYSYLCICVCVCECVCFCSVYYVIESRKKGADCFTTRPSHTIPHHTTQKKLWSQSWKFQIVKMAVMSRYSTIIMVYMCVTVSTVYIITTFSSQHNWLTPFFSLSISLSLFLSFWLHIVN